MLNITNGMYRIDQIKNIQPAEIHMNYVIYNDFDDCSLYMSTWVLRVMQGSNG